MYTYLPDTCFDSCTQRVTAAIVLSGFTGESFAHQMKLHTYAYNTALLSKHGIVQSRKEKVSSGYTILLRYHGHTFTLPLNMATEDYLPYHSSSFISEKTRLNIAESSSVT